ncbi:MAG: HD domain-containing protein [Eggerthellaceae bacterium]|nr:HD domain-containing protein [Eggerthellaceae bacterium]
MTTIQLLNMTFDVWSALFNVILIVGVFVSRRHNQLQARSLVYALLANMCVNVAEVLAYAFRGDASQLGYLMVRIANFSVFLCNHLLLIFGAVFVFRTIEKDGRPVSAAFKRTYAGIIVFGIVLLVLSRVFGFYYAFDDQNRYYRTSGYGVMIAILFVAMMLMFALTIKERERLTRIEKVSIIMFETLPAVAMVAQLFTYGISLTTFASTLSLTMMFIAYELEVSRSVVENERRMLHDVISALAEAVDAKDPYTRGHSSRVALYSRMLAERMGLGADEVERVVRMAILHDVGKIGVPDAVLNKPGKLTDEEFDLIKSHARRGGDILDKVKSMPDLSAGARWHHEHYDGRGYPDGLAGEAIPLEARIICVADSYDAMTSDRVYREHLSQDVVREEIVNGMGTQFDPAIAKAMLEIIDEDADYQLHE